MAAPSIAVIIPTYNYASGINQAITSVLNQTLPAVEIIVVDDGSTDDTRNTLDTYGSRIRYLYQQNRGASAARNAGVLAANCEWVAFLDHDDEWYPTKLACQAASVVESGAEFCYTGYERLLTDDSKKKLSRLTPTDCFPNFASKTCWDPARCFLSAGQRLFLLEDSTNALGRVARIGNLQSVLHGLRARLRSSKP